MIEIIEHLNFEYFEFAMLENSYENVYLRGLTYDSKGNSYWFMYFLYDKLNLK